MLILIVMLAFTNFFFVINQNVQGTANPYVQERTKVKFLDALLSVYLINLGEYGLDGYGEGPNVFLVFAMFIAATFLLIIVFLNMLVAIMGFIFNDFQAIKEESSKMEQALLIQDHIWLHDTKDIFFNQRYIIVLTPDITTTNLINDMTADIKETGLLMTKKIDAMNVANLHRQT